MSFRSRWLFLVLSCWPTLARCSISSPSVEGRACPCIEGFACVGEICIALIDGGETLDGNEDIFVADVIGDDVGAARDVGVDTLFDVDASVPSDVGPVDSCVVQELRCADGVDDDCDGDVDCADPDCRCEDRAVEVHNAEVPSVDTIGPTLRLNLPPGSRYLDTRESSPELERADGSRAGPLSLGAVDTLNTGAWRGAWFNLTGVSGQVGRVLMYPPDITPDEPNLNFRPLDIVSNSTIVPIGVSHRLRVQAVQGSTDLVVDILGTFSEDGGFGLALTEPTRYDSEGVLPVASNQRIDLGDISAAGVVITASAVTGTAPGFMVFFPCDGPPPIPGGHINFRSGSRTTNLIVSRLEGGVCVRLPNPDLGTTALIVDTVAIVDPSITTRYQPIDPIRMIDTELEENTRWTGLTEANQVLHVQVADLPSMPPNIQSVVVGVTAVAATRGDLEVFPCGAPSAVSPSLRYPGENVAAPTLAISALSPDGQLCVRAGTRARIVLSVIGVWIEPST